MLEYPFKLYGINLKFKANSWAQARMMFDAHKAKLRAAAAMYQRQRKAAQGTTPSTKVKPYYKFRDYENCTPRYPEGTLKYVGCQKAISTQE